MNKPASRSRASKILNAAIVKTDQVQEELHQAVETLSSANAVLGNPMSSTQAAAAVANAVEQNAAAETTVQEAAQELEAVKDLIKEAQAHEGAETTEPRHAGEGTTSILAYFEGKRAQARDDELQRDGKEEQ